jgi:hypothetical protein
MDKIEREVILELGRGPRPRWWIARSLGVSDELWVQHALNLAVHDGFAERRGDEWLYPQTDRRGGPRRKRGKRDKRYKKWTEKRTYYALTIEGRALLPLNSIVLGEVTNG